MPSSARLVTVLTLSAPALAQTALLSTSSTGQPGDDNSLDASTSFDGRFAAFESDADNLLPGDTGFGEDVFLRDLATWNLELISATPSGAFPNGRSREPTISADGRWVAFSSRATNLGPQDGNNKFDIYLRDRLTLQTILVSRGLAGANSDGDSFDPDVSADGRFVVFHSLATNLVPGDSNNASDIFIWDRNSGAIQGVSSSTGGVQGNGHSYGATTSGDARFVAFASTATNLVPGDTNGWDDVFRRDLLTGAVERMSLSSSGAQANQASEAPRISFDGSTVVFTSAATNLVAGDNNGVKDVFVRTPLLGTTEAASVGLLGLLGNQLSTSAFVSFDGRYVCFQSGATNLVLGDTNPYEDVFVRDRLLAQTTRVSLDAAGNQATNNSRAHAFSANGRFVFFSSTAALAFPVGPPGIHQLYLHDRGLVCITPYAYCTAKTNSLGCTPGIATYGCSSVSAPDGFYVLGFNVRNNKSGLLFYGLNGQAGLPFQGGTLCVAPPILRTPATNAGGNPSPANDCSGLFVIDMNAFARGLGGGNPSPALLQPGQIVSCQWWGRDQGFPAPKNTTLTNGLEYLVGL